MRDPLSEVLPDADVIVVFIIKDTLCMDMQAEKGHDSLCVRASVRNPLKMHRDTAQSLHTAGRGGEDPRMRPRLNKFTVTEHPPADDGEKHGNEQDTEPDEPFWDKLSVKHVGQGQREEYQNGHRAPAMHMKGRGQLKLFLVDTAAILAFHKRFGAFPQYIVIAGAAPGTHFLKVVMLFPKSIQWNFYDTENFEKRIYEQLDSLDNVSLHQKYYDDNECARWREFRSVLFLSDIRTTTHIEVVKNIEALQRYVQRLRKHKDKQTTKYELRITKCEKVIKQQREKIEDIVAQDMETQIRLWKLTQPVAALLKWRPRWPDVSDIPLDEKVPDGNILVQPFALPNSTEARLLEFCTNAEDVIGNAKEYQLQPDRNRPKAEFKEISLNKEYLKQYEQWFAYINRHERPRYDEQATKVILDEVKRVLNIQLDESILMGAAEDYQTPPKLPASEDQWRLVGDNRFITAWKFHATEEKLKELSKRPGCTPAYPFRSDICKFQIANEYSRNFKDDYRQRIEPICQTYFPFPFMSENLQHYSFWQRNVLLVADTVENTFYYFDFDQDNQWRDLYCVKAKYDSCSTEGYDKRFHELLGFAYDFTQPTADTSASTFVSYLLLTRPYFDPGATPAENQINFARLKLPDSRARPAVA